MIGKLLGRVVGEVIAAPATLITEGGKAIEEAGKVLEHRVADATEPKEKR